MTRQEHLLTIFAEELVETAQRVSKALRFGLGEVSPGQDLTNAERLHQEMTDVMGAWYMLTAENDLVSRGFDPNVVIEKQNKIERFLKYSKEQGTLCD